MYCTRFLDRQIVLCEGWLRYEWEHMKIISYESMNVFPIYPRPIIMKLKTKDFDINLEKNNNLQSIDLKLNDILIDKIKEFKSYNSLFGKNKNYDYFIFIK